MSWTQTMPSTETAVAVTHLSRRFGDIRALCDVSFQVERGTVFGLLGENGSGKTTLMKLLMGHLKPHAGTISILGRGLARESDLLALRRRVAYVPEQRYLMDRMRVDEIMAFNRGTAPGCA